MTLIILEYLLCAPNKLELITVILCIFLEYSEDNFDGLLSKDRALRNRHTHVYNLYKKVLTLFIKSAASCRPGRRLLDQDEGVQV